MDIVEVMPPSFPLPADPKRLGLARPRGARQRSPLRRLALLAPNEEAGRGENHHAEDTDLDHQVVELSPDRIGGFQRGRRRASALTMNVGGVASTT